MHKAPDVVSGAFVFLAEDTRFELVRACTQPAFQASAIGL